MKRALKSGMDMPSSRHEGFGHREAAVDMFGGVHDRHDVNDHFEIVKIDVVKIKFAVRSVRQS